MAASITIQNTIDFSRPYLNWANLTIGTGEEPARSAANLILQTITGPPFSWPWNSSSTTFLASQGTQDYNVALSAFGFLESASIQSAAVITSVSVTSNVATYTAVNNFSALANGGVGETVLISGCSVAAMNGSKTILSATATTFVCNVTTADIVQAQSGAKALAGRIMPLEIKWDFIGEAVEQDRPTFISLQSSSESGINLVFRLLPVPAETAQITLNYQLAPNLYTAVSNTWGIPDQLQYIYTYFFMFLMFDYFDDPRAGRYRQLAVASLMARQEGLSEQDRSLFLGTWLPLNSEEQNNALMTQQGATARGL